MIFQVEENLSFEYLKLLKLLEKLLKKMNMDIGKILLN